MTTTNFSQDVFTFQGSEIQKMTFGEYLTEHWNDMTTSPRGNENRRLVCSVLVDDGDNIIDYSIQDQDGLIGDEDLTLKWAVYTWNSGGSGPLKIDSELFDTEEDAEIDILEGFEHDYNNGNSNVPAAYFSEDEAISEMATEFGKPEDVVRRFLKIAAISAQKAVEYRAEMTRQHDARKQWLAIEVPKEAASIAIDEEFKAAIQWAEKATGNEKSTRMASAAKGLLNRNNIAQIKTDFWQVLRILKGRAEG